jgi:glucose-1-phosphate thymidylyltransferase
MKGIVLAGGHSPALYPLTEKYPRALLGVAGKPALHHLLENMCQVPDLDDLLVVVDPESRSLFENNETLRTVWHKIPRLYDPPSTNHGHVTGPVAKLSRAMRDVKGFDKGSSYLVVGGDNVFGFELNDFCERYRKDPSKQSYMAVRTIPTPHDIAQVGVPTINEAGHVTGYREKPAFTIVGTACYILRPKDVALADEYLKKGHDDVLGLFMTWLVNQTTMGSYEFESSWSDIGTRRGLLSANRLLMEWRPENQKIPHLTSGETRIIPPVYVEDGATVSNSTVGPNAYVGAKATIHDSVVSDSIVYDGARVDHCELRGSVIGGGSHVQGVVVDLVVGPHSSVIAQ